MATVSVNKKYLATIAQRMRWKTEDVGSCIIHEVVQYYLKIVLS